MLRACTQCTVVYGTCVQGVQGEAGFEVLQARLALQAQQDPHVRIHVHREGALLVQKGRLLTTISV